MKHDIAPTSARIRSGVHESREALEPNRAERAYSRVLAEHRQWVDGPVRVTVGRLGGRSTATLRDPASALLFVPEPGSAGTLELRTTACTSAVPASAIRLQVDVREPEQMGLLAPGRGLRVHAPQATGLIQVVAVGAELLAEAAARFVPSTGVRWTLPTRPRFCDPVLLRTVRHYSTALRDGECDPIHLRCLRHALATTLLTRHALGLGAARQRARPLPMLSLRQVLGHIDRHSARPLAVADLAAIARQSVPQFGRAFVTTTGLTPYRYLTLRRIERAKALLVDTDMGLSQVALEAGFATQSHFTHVFRKTCGATPGDFRAMCR